MTAARLSTNQSLVYPIGSMMPRNHQTKLDHFGDATDDDSNNLAKISELTEDEDDSLWLLSIKSSKSPSNQIANLPSRSARFPVSDEDKPERPITPTTNRQLTTIPECHWHNNNEPHTPEKTNRSRNPLEFDKISSYRLQPNSSLCETSEKLATSSGNRAATSRRRGSADSSNCDCTAIAWAALARRSSSRRRRWAQHRLSFEDDSYGVRSPSYKTVSKAPAGSGGESVSTDSGLGSTCSSSCLLSVESVPSSRSGSMTSQTSATAAGQRKSAAELPPPPEGKRRRSRAAMLGWLLLGGSVVRRWLSPHSFTTKTTKPDVIIAEEKVRTPL